MSVSWKSRVYRKPEEEPYILSQVQFRKIKSALAKECGYCCQCCRKQFTVKSLTLHHIVPARNGGSDSVNNLILLCNDCHVYVETNIEEFPTRIKIEYALSVEVTREARKKPDGSRWQTWVYGGCRNPNHGPRK